MINYLRYLPHFAFPLAASYGVMPCVHEQKKVITEITITHNLILLLMTKKSLNLKKNDLTRKLWEEKLIRGIEGKINQRY